MSKAIRAVLLSACLLFGASCGSPDPDEHYRRGNDYLERGALNEAVIEYKLALQADPNRGDVRLTLADTYTRQSLLNEARVEYVRAADLRPNDAVAQVKAGLSLLRSGMFEEARARAEKAISVDPRNADAQVLLGNAMAGLQDMDAALSEYQRAIALNPAQAAAHTNIGVVQVLKGQLTDAEVAFRKAIEVAPSSVEARLALVNFLWTADRLVEAEELLKQTVAQHPKDIQAQRALGIFYLASGRPEEAEPSFLALDAAIDTPEASLAVADYYLSLKRFDEASRILGGLASTESSYAAATMRLAAIDAAQGSRALAMEKLRAVIQKSPTEMWARLMIARLHLVDGKRDEALKEAGEIVKQAADSPASTEAYTLIGSIYSSLDRRSEAIRAFQEVLKRQSKPVGAQIALASLHFSNYSFDAAKTHVQEALRMQPQDPAARVLLVRIRLAEGDLRTARQELTALRTEFPNEPAVLTLVAAQELASGNLAGARVAYSRAAQLSPNDVAPLTGLVQLDISSGRTKEALDRVEAGLKHASPTAEFLTLAGHVYSMAGELDRAEQLLQRAIAAEPDALRAYAMLGAVYVRQKRLHDAVAQFQAITKRSPESVGAQTMLGMLYESQRRTSDAERQYKTVLSFDPEAAVAANNLAWIYVSEGRDLPEALQLAQRAQQKLPDDPQINDTLGWIYHKQNEPTLAIRHLSRSLEKDPINPSVHYHLGMAYLAAFDTDNARASLQRALAGRGDFDGIAEAKKALVELNQ